LSSAQISDDWSFRGFSAVILENELLRLSVFPDLGAKVYDLVYKPSMTNILWHNPRIPLGRPSFGSRFDDVWSGGWDEIFPTDAESVVEGVRYPEMGEVWGLPWKYEIEQRRHSVSVTTKVVCPISPAEITRKITLRGGDTGARFYYEIRNLSSDEIRFLWKVHAAFPINDECRIDIEAKRGIVDPKYSDGIGSKSYPWPTAKLRSGAELDVSRVRPEDRTCTLHYVTGLEKGAVRFVDPVNEVETEIRFPKNVMDNVWLFLAYGGWRGLYTAVIEPSTSYGTDLAEAIRQGHCSRLEGGGRLTATVDVSVRRTKPVKR
jgi:hypothetical protein